MTKSKARTKILSIVVSLMVAVAFMPALGMTALAEEEVEAPAAPAFDASGKVTGLKVSGYTYKSVKIGWTSYAKASGYEIYRADKKNGKYKKIKTQTTCSYNDKGNKKLGKSKYYKVRAYTSVDGVKVYSKYSSILSAKPKVPAPTSLKSSGGSGKVTLSWAGVSGATKYQVYRATSKNGKYKKIKTTKSKKFTNTSVKKGTKYFYKVRAYRKSGKKKYYSAFTAPKEGMSKLGAPGKLNVKVNSEGTISASWSSVKGASGYQLQRAGANGTYTAVAAVTKCSATDIPSASGEYKYRVRAYSVINGAKQYGAFSSGGGRSSAVKQAQSWVGCKESNGSHKKIIDAFNSYNPSSGKIGYKTPWCAAFVSAVAIKTGNTAVIPVHSYCPTMLSKFSSKTYSKSYLPTGGDVVFYDWNANKVPDHVGMIEKVKGSDITAIEGNYKDAVKRRTYKKGWKLLLAYGLPNYTINSKVIYTAPVVPEEPEEPEEIIDPDVIDEAGVSSEAVETAYDEITEGLADPEIEEDLSEMETAESIVEYVQEENPAEESDADESVYNAVLVYELCDEMDIDACIVTITDEDGGETAYNEVVLDGQMYILDATSGEETIEEYIPEEIN